MGSQYIQRISSIQLITETTLYCGFYNCVARYIVVRVEFLDSLNFTINCKKPFI